MYRHVNNRLRSNHLLSKMDFLRFLSHWIHLVWMCSTTLPSPATSQRRTRSQSRTWTKPSPAPMLKKMPVAAGSAPLPVSSPNHSTGEADKGYRKFSCCCVWTLLTTQPSGFVWNFVLLLFLFPGNIWMISPLCTYDADLFPVVSHVNIFCFFCNCLKRSWFLHLSFVLALIHTGINMKCLLIEQSNVRSGSRFN